MDKKRLQIIFGLNFEIIHKIEERTIEIFYGRMVKCFRLKRMFDGMKLLNY